MTGDSVSATGRASRTAMMAAAGRGFHLFQHGPRAVFADHLGWPLVGPDVEALATSIRGAFGELTPRLATWLAARSRIAEDWLLDSGAEQYVVLGAGLDSFAWRQRGTVQVFEVDHPASQRWKQERLASMGLETPGSLTWVGVDFETDTISEALLAGGLDPARPVFTSWLGVTPYLSSAAISATLADLPASTIAVSYAPPEREWTDEAKQASDAFLPIAQASGEAIVSLLTREEFDALLADAGFFGVEEVRASEVEKRYGVAAVANLDERILLARRA